jgi:hypothetical protein
MPTIDMPCIHLGLHNAGPLCIQNIKVKDMNEHLTHTNIQVCCIYTFYMNEYYIHSALARNTYVQFVSNSIIYMRGRLPACVDSITCICGKDYLQYMCGQSNMCQWGYPNV